MHAIEEGSPFFGEGALERLRAADAEIFLTFSGTDETFAQTIHSRHGYQLEDIAFDHRFVDVLHFAEDGAPVIDYTKFHLVTPAEKVAA
jgi:inward rectifier potassium channel